MNADDENVLETKKDLHDKNLYAYCDNNPVIRYDDNGDFWELALAGGGSVAAGSGISLNAIGGSIIARVGAITPTGWVVIGAVTLGIQYAKNKTRTKSKPKIPNKDKSTDQQKVRSKHPIGKRINFSTRKKALEAAKRASKGKTPRKDYSSKKGDKIRPHYHPNVKNEYRVTPHGHSVHDHYYYPR